MYLSLSYIIVYSYSYSHNEVLRYRVLLILNTEIEKMKRLRDGEADTDAIPTAVLLGVRRSGGIVASSDLYERG